MSSSMHDWSLGVGNLVYGFYLQGIASKELLYIYDMPKTFAKSDDAEGTYGNIQFKKSGGEWFFNPVDLINVGLLKTDGTFNADFVPQQYNSENATKEFEEEWISFESLSSIYGINAYWAGDQINLSSYSDESNWIITGSPKNKFEEGVIYNCSYNGNTVRVKYSKVASYSSANFLFYYDDLVATGII